MKLSYIIAAIEEFAPRSLQEAWDNSGLQIGLPYDSDGECTGALLCVDVTEAIIAEAVARGCNLVVSHHPLIFKGLKALSGSTPVQRAVEAAIRAGVAVYSAHTSLDSTEGGISYAMAQALGATPLRVLAPAAAEMMRMSVTCPREAAADVRLALLDIAPDARCTYAPVEAETIGPEAMITHTPLTRVEVSVAAHQVRHIAANLRTMPGGDRFAIDTVALTDRDTRLGLGLVADLPETVDGATLLRKIKERFGIPAVRASLGFDPAMQVRRIAMCGGAGGEFIPQAEAAGAAVYITADVRYHDFADHRAGMAILDIGHFESESCAKQIFYSVITNKFPNFAVYYSENEQNPVKYL